MVGETGCNLTLFLLPKISKFTTVSKEGIWSHLRCLQLLILTKSKEKKVSVRGKKQNKTIRPENSAFIFLAAHKYSQFQEYLIKKRGGGRILDSFSLFPEVSGINSSQPLIHFHERKKSR